MIRVKFDYEKFLEQIDSLETNIKTFEKINRLKNIVMAVFDGNINYDSFTREEAEEILRHAYDYEYSYDTDEEYGNLFKLIFHSDLLAQRIAKLPRRREGCEFI